MTHWGRCSENCLQTITKYRLVKHSIGNWHFSTIFRSSHFDTNSRWNIVSQISRSNPLWAASHDLISSVAESTGLWYHIIGSAITIFYIIKIRILFGTCNSDVIGYLTHTHTHTKMERKKSVCTACVAVKPLMKYTILNGIHINYSPMLRREIWCCYNGCNENWQPIWKTIFTHAHNSMLQNVKPLGAIIDFRIVLVYIAWIVYDYQQHHHHHRRHHCQAVAEAEAEAIQTEERQQWKARKLLRCW